MPYAIMRFKKTGTGGIAPAQKHNEREKTKYKSNPDIDAKRIKNDYHIIKPDKPYRAVIKDRIASANCRSAAAFASSSRLARSSGGITRSLTVMP